MNYLDPASLQRFEMPNGVLQILCKEVGAVEAFILVKQTEMKRFIVFRWKSGRKRKVTIPEYLSLPQAKEWFSRVADELTPKKPRPGAARRKTQPSIKSKVIKSLSEVALHC